MTLTDAAGLLGGVLVLFGVLYSALQRRNAKLSAELFKAKAQTETEEARNSIKNIMEQVERERKELEERLNQYRSDSNDDPSQS